MTPTPTQALEPVEVTQADRDAAAEYMRLFPDLRLPEAFARHRDAEARRCTAITQRITSQSGHSQSSNAASVGVDPFAGRIFTRASVEDAIASIRAEPRTKGTVTHSRFDKFDVDHVVTACELLLASLSTPTAEPSSPWPGDGMREALAKEIAAIFARRNWLSMAKDALELRACMKSHGAVPPFMEDELTEQGAYEAADRIMREVPGVLAALTPSTLSDLHPLGQEYDGDALEGPFHVSRSSNGEKQWFSARDPAAGVTIPGNDRADAYALAAALNRSCEMFARSALSATPPAQEEG
ncbi:hypothetical protein FHR22_002589 [Sphingopyxis panaciterrae]|uniref:hypothetical protein n=1 Tax=Sphingopyxis panaciterrae TaxID=363841 RepID=UPI00141D824E|nr:hypothetical protein [Sphingopyxis panaciterrae]NIJ37886.1 hypothetical protein [Sphingopyxis panaciterrae]